MAKNVHRIISDRWKVPYGGKTGGREGALVPSPTVTIFCLSA